MNDCDTCPRNEKQAALICKIWAINEQLRKRVEKLSERVETQQGMIDWLRAQKNAPTAEEIAEQIFKDAGNG